MATTTFNQTIARNYIPAASRTSIATRFINWCERQQENRILWIGLALGVHGCILAPLAIYMITMSGNSLALFMTAMASMCAALVVNLAAMPTKITIPVFFATLVVDIVLIAACAAAILQ
jgi:hypothetical protein